MATHPLLSTISLQEHFHSGEVKLELIRLEVRGSIQLSMEKEKSCNLKWQEAQPVLVMASGMAWSPPGTAASSLHNQDNVPSPSQGLVPHCKCTLRQDLGSVLAKNKKQTTENSKQTTTTTKNSSEATSWKGKIQVCILWGWNLNFVVKHSGLRHRCFWLCFHGSHCYFYLFINLVLFEYIPCAQDCFRFWVNGEEIGLGFHGVYLLLQKIFPQSTDPCDLIIALILTQKQFLQTWKVPKDAPCDLLCECSWLSPLGWGTVFRSKASFFGLGEIGAFLMKN